MYEDIDKTSTSCVQILYLSSAAWYDTYLYSLYISIPFLSAAAWHCRAAADSPSAAEERTQPLVIFKYHNIKHQ